MPSGEARPSVKIAVSASIRASSSVGSPRSRRRVASKASRGQASELRRLGARLRREVSGPTMRLTRPACCAASADRGSPSARKEKARCGPSCCVREKGRSCFGRQAKRRERAERLARGVASTISQWNSKGRADADCEPVNRCDQGRGARGERREEGRIAASAPRPEEKRLMSLPAQKNARCPSIRHRRSSRHAPRKQSGRQRGIHGGRQRVALFPAAGRSGEQGNRLRAQPGS